MKKSCDIVGCGCVVAFLAVVMNLLPAEAEGIYQLKGDVSGGLDLTAMSGYRTDRLSGSDSVSATINGGIKYAGVTASNPFTIYGYGHGITFGDFCDLETDYVALEQMEGVAVRTDLMFGNLNGSLFRGFSNAKDTRLVIGYQMGAFSAAGEGAQSAEVKINGEVYGYSGMYIGTDKGDAHLIVGSTGAILLSDADQDLRLGYQSAPTSDGREIRTWADVGGTLSVRDVLLNDLVRGNGVETCYLTNNIGGHISARSIRCSGGNYSRFVFNGGTLGFPGKFGAELPLFEATGYSYDGNYPSPRLIVEGVAGHPIDISIALDRNLCGGWGCRPIMFVGDGGFVKRGTGVLSWTANESYYWEEYATKATYTGETRIVEGGIRLSCPDYRMQPGRGVLVLEGEGTTFDLNGVNQAEAFTGATGLGSIVNTAGTTAQFCLGYGNQDGELSVAVDPAVDVVKTGTGTLTLKGAVADFSGNLTVSGGMVILGVGMTKLNTVTINAGAVLDVRGVEFGYANLVNNGGTLLMDDTTVFVVSTQSSDKSIQFLPNLAGLVKKGEGTLTVNGLVQVSGSVAVNGGTLTVRPTEVPYKYFRIDLIAGPNGATEKLIGEFCLYDSTGNRINQGNYTMLGNAGEGIYGSWGTCDPSTLGENECCVFGGGYHIFYTGDVYSGYLNYALDGNLDTQTFLRDGWGSECCALRIPASAGRVAAYNFISGLFTDKELTKWRIYGSEDGINWTLLSDMSENTAHPNMAKTPYNEGVPFFFGGVESTEAAFGPDAVVSVAANATLTLANATMQIGHLAVDMTSTGGTITRFTPSISGTLALTNFSGQLDDLSGMPLMYVGEIVGKENLKGWTVSVNGQVESKLRVKFRDGALYALPPLGLAITVR